VDRDDRIRAAAVAWLDELLSPGHEQVTMNELVAFVFEGENIRLMDRGRGIRHPRSMRSALSITTSYSSPNLAARYVDNVGADGLQRYKYRRDSGGGSENLSVRQAMKDGSSLIWFVGSSPHRYVPIYPVWIIADEPAQSQFVVAFDAFQRQLSPGDASQRDYAERITRTRLHQPVFRAQVLGAYDHMCAMCRLRYPVLLDAAHILRDGHPRGEPVVSNGMSLCKIHHAAYDENYLGVRPDYVIEVRRDVKQGRDGPMLLHGIQEMDGIRLRIPRSEMLRPDRVRLDERYSEFLRVG
jgi:putative restriction endonuclease